MRALNWKCFPFRSGSGGQQERRPLPRSERPQKESETGRCHVPVSALWRGSLSHRGPIIGPKHASEAYQNLWMLSTVQSGEDSVCFWASPQEGSGQTS